MKTIDIYTTPQCPFCKQLKLKLDQKNIAYKSYDITKNERAFTEMQKLTKGVMSVPAMVLNKGQTDQKVTVGYTDALSALHFESGDEAKNTKQTRAMLACPQCGHKQEGEIPTKACVPFYVCKGCRKTIQAKWKECCVFCSYADKKCPVKSGKSGCEGGVCRI